MFSFLFVFMARTSVSCVLGKARSQSNRKNAPPGRPFRPGQSTLLYCPIRCQVNSRLWPETVKWKISPHYTWFHQKLQSILLWFLQAPPRRKKRGNKSAKGRIGWLDFSEKPAILGMSNSFFCVIRANFVSKYAIFAGSVAKRPALCYALPVEPGGYAARGQAATPSQNPPSPATESSCCKVCLTAVLCA